MKEDKAAEAAPKKQNILVRVLAFLLTLVLVLGAVALVAWRDELNLDALKRYLTYRSLSKSESGQTEAFSYTGDADTVYATLDGGLLVCSANSIQLFSQSGTEYVNKTVSLEQPVISASGSTAVVYDLNGTQLYAYSDRQEVFSLQTEEKLLGVRINEAGWLAVITEATGYKAAVTVYDASFQPVMRRSISSAFVMDAVVSPDGKQLAVVTVGQNGADFESRLTFYPMSEEDATASAALGSDVVLSLRWDSRGIWAVGEYGLTLVSSAGEVQWVWSYSGRYLKSFAPGDGYMALLLGRYRSGSTGELTVVDSAGEVTGTMNITEEVLSVSAAGRYVSVLTGEALNIYSKELQSYAQLENGGDLRQAIQREDGSAMVIGARRASLFVPD